MKINKPLDGNHVFLMSDLHYGHENILRLSKRPFMSIDDMNKIPLQTELLKNPICHFGFIYQLIIYILWLHLEFFFL